MTKRAVVVIPDPRTLKVPAKAALLLSALIKHGNEFCYPVFNLSSTPVEGAEPFGQPCGHGEEEVKGAIRAFFDQTDFNEVVALPLTALTERYYDLVNHGFFWLSRAPLNRPVITYSTILLDRDLPMRWISGFGQMNPNDEDVEFVEEKTIRDNAMYAFTRETDLDALFDYTAEHFMVNNGVYELTAKNGELRLVKIRRKPSLLKFLS